MAAPQSNLCVDMPKIQSESWGREIAFNKCSLLQNRAWRRLFIMHTRLSDTFCNIDVTFLVTLTENVMTFFKKIFTDWPKLKFLDRHFLNNIWCISGIRYEKAYWKNNNKNCRNCTRYHSTYANDRWLESLKTDFFYQRQVIFVDIIYKDGIYTTSAIK